MTDKNGSGKIGRQLHRRRTSRIYDFVVGSVNDKPNKEGAELLRNRIVGRRLRVTYDINGILIKQVENPAFTMLNGPAMRDVWSATSLQSQAG